MKIVALSPRPGFHLSLTFADGLAGEVDLSDLVGIGVFRAWREPGVFEQVRVSEHGAAEWPGEIDLCPDALYLRLSGKPAEELFPALRALHVHA
ncbi:MAG TPA: DUF2442 domain-containing protein [Bacteroidia bacterium]|nr:DUF2442 domain-containing protein [Bacteroidia bacterium]